MRSFRDRVKNIKNLMVALLLTASTVLVAAPVQADTLPPSSSVPKTVSADPQPTAQINGVIWDQVVSGRTVYAVGNFTQVRPAGVALGGSGTVTRQNILAYDIVTGELVSGFNHSLVNANAPADINSNAMNNKIGDAVAISRDGKYLYVGGKFTHVDGVAKSNFVVFNLATGAIVSGFPTPDRSVSSIAVDDQRVFIAGEFSNVAGTARGHLAAYKLDGSFDTGWKASVNDGTVASIVRVNNNLVVGGRFTKLNNATYYAVGAVSATTGANVPWASQSASFPIRLQDPNGGSGTSVTHMSTDGSQVYLTAFTYISGTRPGTFEGRWAISGTDGKLIWMNDCIGDSYSSFPIGGVLYSASHAHSCKAVGGFPEVIPRRYQHALAETTNVTGKNIANNGGNYPSYAGQPAATLLHWYPRFSPAPNASTATSPIVSGASQAGWSVTGAVIDGVTYIAYGGEFTKVEGKPQQGIVRFKTTGTVKTATENAIGPHTNYRAYPVDTRPASSSGVSAVYVDMADPDNQTLTFDTYRADDNKLLSSQTLLASKTLLDTRLADRTGVKSGTTQRYNVIARDAYGNQTLGYGIIDDTDYRMMYSGSGWKTSTGRTTPDANRTVHYSTSAGAAVTANFVGTEVRVVVEKRTTTGRLGISIDGGAEQIVQTALASGTKTQYQQTVFTAGGLSFGVHSIKIRNLDSGKYFLFDGIDARGGLFYDDTYTDNGLTYSGTWVNRQDFSRYELNGGTHYTSSTAASVTLKFKGTYVGVVSRLLNSHDVMSVTVDGTQTKTCDSYSATSKKPVVLCDFSGLANTDHTIVVKKVSGNNIVLDGFVVR